MAAPVLPVICSAQQVYDYMQITAPEAAANLLNATTTRAAFIANLMLFTASQIVSWLGYDYTTNALQALRLQGNCSSSWRFGFPIGTIAVAKSWDPNNPTVSPIDLTTILDILSIDINTIYRTDGGIFQQNLWYIFEFQQASDPYIYNGWPQECIQVQLEMIATIYRESSNNDNIVGNFSGLPESTSGLAITEIHKYLSTEFKYEDLTSRWKDRLRGARKIAI
jgi:hypothetical protein